MMHLSSSLQWGIYGSREDSVSVKVADGIEEGRAMSRLSTGSMMAAPSYMVVECVSRENGVSDTRPDTGSCLITVSRWREPLITTPWQNMDSGGVVGPDVLLSVAGDLLSMACTHIVIASASADERYGVKIGHFAVGG